MQISNSHWFALLNRELDGTSDRSCVIVAASIIDHLLSEVLKAFLVPCATVQDTLFDGPTAPLDSFSAKIDFAHRIGLLSAQSSRDLHLIRRMRNDQAHSIEGRTFEDPGLKDQVTKLAKSLDVQKKVPFLLKPPYDSVRGHFTVVAIMIISHLDEMRKLMPSINPLVSDPLYATTWVNSETENG